MDHFWDPLGLHVAESGWVVDGKTDQEHILKQISVSEVQYIVHIHIIILQCPDMKVVSDGRSRPAQPCHRARD